jgi:hypothetical protein
VSITILGHHISHIRPPKVRRFDKENVFRPPRCKTVTRVLGVAEFLCLCMTYDTKWIEEKPKYFER